MLPALFWSEATNPYVLEIPDVVDRVDFFFAAECDFLTCPQDSSCTETSVMGAQCQCSQGYEEEMLNGQLNCIGKLLHIGKVG